MDYYAHISDDGRRQMIAEHLSGTAALCRSFAGEFGAEAEGELMGVLPMILANAPMASRSAYWRAVPLWITPPPVQWPAHGFYAHVLLPV